MEDSRKEQGESDGTKEEGTSLAFTRRKILEMGAWSVPVIVALSASKPNQAYAASVAHGDAHSDAHTDHVD